MKKAADHCRQILNYVNQAVKEAENKQVKRKSKICRMGLENIKVVYLKSEVTESIIQLICRTFVCYSYSSWFQIIRDAFDW